MSTQSSVIKGLKEKSAKNDLNNKGIWKTAAKIPLHRHGDSEYTDFLPPREEITAYQHLKKVTTPKVEYYFQQLSSSKVVFDKIPLEIFKYILSAIIELLVTQYIYNQS